VTIQCCFFVNDHLILFVSDRDVKFTMEVCIVDSEPIRNKWSLIDLLSTMHACTVYLHEYWSTTLERELKYIYFPQNLCVSKIREGTLIVDIHNNALAYQIELSLYLKKHRARLHRVIQKNIHYYINNGPNESYLNWD